MTDNMIEIPVFQSREAGFDSAVTVQLTQAVWNDCVTWTSTDTAVTGIPQDEDGRLWDVLWMTRRAIRAFDTNTKVQLHRWARDTSPAMLDDDDAEPPLVELLAVRGAGTGALSTVTIMQPAEYHNPHANCGGHAYQQVTCDRCKRTYQCTPSSDYYCAAEGDHCCEPCLLTGIAPDGVIVVDARPDA
jgi:hypothetical protein